MELSDFWITPEELTPLMKRANKIYELPGFEITLKDTCEWAGKLAALCCEEQTKKVIAQVLAMFDEATSEETTTMTDTVLQYQEIIEELRKAI